MKVYGLVLINFLFSFQGLIQEKIPRFASIVSDWLYKNITQQFSGQIVQIISLKFGFLLIFLTNLRAIYSPLRLKSR